MKLMYSMTIVNTVVWYIQKLRVDPKSFHHKEKPLFLYLYEMTNVNLLWSFHHKSNRYAVHLKRIQWCMSITSQ